LSRNGVVTEYRYTGRDNKTYCNYHAEGLYDSYIYHRHQVLVLAFDGYTGGNPYLLICIYTASKEDYSSLRKRKAIHQTLKTPDDPYLSPIGNAD
jgi:hypothetical protein